MLNINLRFEHSEDKDREAIQNIWNHQKYWLEIKQRYRLANDCVHQFKGKHLQDHKMGGACKEMQLIALYILSKS